MLYPSTKPLLGLYDRLLPDVPTLLPHPPHPLPIDAVLPQLVDALSSARAVVLKAPPGTGKSTRVPGALLDARWYRGEDIWMLEPRRIAARATAARIAEERGTQLGDEIGYQVRFEKCFSERTRIRIVTEGIATRSFIRDPFLEGVGCLILDEFHERNIDTDLCLAFAKELLHVRDDFRLIVMSATMETDRISQYLDDAPVITCDVRTHPLHIEYLPRKQPNDLAEQVVSAVDHLVRADVDDGGDILVFLPGAAEIHRAEKKLAASRVAQELALCPLYGALPFSAQQKALAPQTRRRVVLATNIAETSLTVSGVSAVIDSGLERRTRVNPRTGLDGLETGFISRESAEQRAGRAGRLGPGRVVRLWSKAEQQQLQLHRIPEIQRVDLAPTVLAILSYQPGDPEAFPFFESPSHAQIQVALQLLQRLDGIALADGQWRITELGKSFCQLPVHPRLAAMLSRAVPEKIAPTAACIAALLSERDFLRSAGSETMRYSVDLSDRISRFEAVEMESFHRAACHRYEVDEAAVRHIAKVRDQLLRVLPSHREQSLEPSATSIGRVLVAAFPDRVCVRVPTSAMEGRMVGGRGVTLRVEDDLRAHELFVAPIMDDPAGAKRSIARMIYPIEVDTLRDVFPDRVISAEDAHFDESRKAVVGIRTLRFDGLVLREQHGVRVDRDILENRLLEQALERWDEVVQLDDEAQRYVSRLRFAQKHLAEEDWPELSPSWFKERIAQHCSRHRSFDDFRTLPWLHEFKNALTWPQQQLLDTEIPERLEVPSGSRITIEYDAAFGPAEAPILAVRLQEVFGLSETPTVAKGRVKVLLHLLAPNLRPVQVTRDLRNFWNETYQNVRKELRQRYPKHAWPEDPWTATAESRPRRKR